MATPLLAPKVWQCSVVGEQIDILSSPWWFAFRQGANLYRDMQGACSLIPWNLASRWKM